MRSLARWTSILLHPFATSLLMVLGSALRFGSPADALRTVLLVGGVALLPIAVLMVRQVRRGAWRNVDASERAERPLLFAVSAVALAALLAWMLLQRPGSPMVRGVVGVLLMLAACALANRWLKVSLHMAFGGLATATLLAIGSPIGWGLLVLLPLLAWSRLALARHRPAEVVVGLAIGLATGWLIAYL